MASKLRRRRLALRLTALLVLSAGLSFLLLVGCDSTAWSPGTAADSAKATQLATAAVQQDAQLAREIGADYATDTVFKGSRFAIVRFTPAPSDGDYRTVEVVIDVQRSEVVTVGVERQPE